MRTITGLTRARRGRITLADIELTRLAPHRVARAGVAYVPSGRRVFGTLTVRQNLELARRAARIPDPSWTIERVQEVFPKLRELDDRRAGLISGGEQQMLKLGRALLAHPKVLLLDEPTEGLAPVVVAEMTGWVEMVKQEGISILLAEQNSLFALGLADRGYILEKGRIRHTASAADLSQSAEVRTYLGIQQRGRVVRTPHQRDAQARPRGGSAGIPPLPRQHPQD